VHAIDANREASGVTGASGELHDAADEPDRTTQSANSARPRPGTCGALDSSQSSTRRWAMRSKGFASLARDEYVEGARPVVCVNSRKVHPIERAASRYFAPSSARNASDGEKACTIESKTFFARLLDAG